MVITNMPNGGGGGGVVISITPPTFVNNEFTYNRLEQGPTVSGYDPGIVRLTGNVIETNANRDGEHYTLRAEIINPKQYVWSDGGNAPKEYSWTIFPKKIAIPTLSGSYTYNGGTQRVAISEYDSNEVLVTGDTSGQNAATYTVRFNLASTQNYRWNDDNSITEKTRTWIISKAVGNITLSTQTVKLDNNTKSQTVTISNATGTVSLQVGSGGYATASLTDQTHILITGVKNGDTTVTVNVAMSANYNGTSKVINVNVNFVTGKPWNTATEAEVKAMLDSYYASNDIKALKDYWAVGDERTMNIAAHQSFSGDYTTSHTAQTSCPWVILDFQHDTLTSAQGSTTKAGVTIQMKGMLSKDTSTGEYGRMETTDTNANGWHGCARRSQCNGNFYNALSFKSWVKRVKKSAATKGNQISQFTTDDDYCFLLSEWEVFGAKTYSAGDGTEAHEGTQYKWYETASNRIKKRGTTQSGSAHYWWLRSPRASGTTAFCSVGNGGNAGSTSAGSYYGLSVACCL